MEDKKKMEVNNKFTVNVLNVITIILVVAKCFGFVNLTWFQCFIPFIINIVVALVLLLVVGIIAWRHNYW